MIVRGFEYGAILKGSQTEYWFNFCGLWFEYGAILKGSQTNVDCIYDPTWFEYGAILKGSQTPGLRSQSFQCVWVWCNFKG